MQRFSGYVQNIKYQAEGSGYYILNMYIEQTNKSSVVVGTVCGIKIAVGSWFAFEGEWGRHEKFGPQLKIKKAPLFEESSPDEMFKTLTTHGVSEEVLTKVKDKTGDRFLETLGSRKLLQEILDPQDAQYLHERWKVITSVFKSIDILASLGISNKQLSNIWRAYPDNVYDILTSNPWALVSVDGIDFKFCDELANSLNISCDSPLRYEGAALYSVQQTRTMGSLYVGTGPVVKHMRTLLKEPNLSPERIGAALKSLHENKSIVIDRLDNVSAIYEPWNYFIESYSAEALLKRKETAVLSPEVISRMNESLPQGDGCLRDKIERVISQSGGGVSLSKMQISAAVNAIVEPISILTGGPGSGKTTTLRTVVRFMRDMNIKFTLVAPTGIAAKRLQAVAGVPAFTIHKAFGATGIVADKESHSSYEGIVSSETKDIKDGSESDWGYHQNCPIDADVVIIDETSMVDQHVFYRVLAGTKETTRIVLVGDAAQLPSVGAGNVLSDLIKSNVFPTVSLSEIFRQEDTSEIVFVAHEIKEGKVPSEEIMQKDFLFIEQREESQILETVLKLVTSLYEKRANFQVMSPRHAGTLGVTNLNGEMRKIINPQRKNRKELKMGDDTIREEDRIMVFQNDYALEVFNGDIGKVSFISDSRNEIEIKLHENTPRNILMKQEDARRLLRLAYAVTCHKVQGLEFDVVVIPWVKGFGKQLKRNLLYTAVTRAKKRVLVVGHKDAFVQAILDEKAEVRSTLLVERLNGRLAKKN